MPFDISISNQSTTLEDQIKGALFHKLYEASKKTQWIRLSGFGVGVVCSLLTIVKRIAQIGENLIKGLGNIFGARCFEKCKLKTGLIQLFRETPADILCLPFSVIAAATGLISKTILIAWKPQKNTYNRWYYHARKDVEKYEFEQAHLLTAEIPKNVKALKHLAFSYENGVGIDKNLNKAFEYYKRAAKQNDTYCMSKTGTFLYEGTGTEKNVKKALEWQQKAAEAGNGRAMAELGYYYEVGLENNILGKDAKLALDWYNKGVKQEDPKAMFRLGTMYALGCKDAGLERSPEKAVELYRKACDRLEHEAIPYLTVMLMEHPNLEKFAREWTLWNKKTTLEQTSKARNVLMPINIKVL